MVLPRSLSKGLGKVGFHFNRLAAEASARQLRAASHTLESLHRLPRLPLDFIPQTSFALSASAVRIILNDFVLHQRRYVVELGTGISTLYFSKILAAHPDALLITVDHDADWLAHVAALVRQIGTTAAVRFVHAPLTAPASPGAAPWYAHAPIEAALGGALIDALIVDGPKARGQEDSETRRPAVPFFVSRLNPAGAVIYLDDITRAGERRIYEDWSRDFALDHMPLAEFCGLGVLVPRDRPLRLRIV